MPKYYKTLYPLACRVRTDYLAYRAWQLKEGKVVVEEDVYINDQHAQSRNDNTTNIASFE